MITIDKMNQSDLIQIQSLYRELIAQGVSMDTLETHFQRIENDKRYYCVVVRDESKIVGTCRGILCIALDTPFLVVENVVVDEKSRGKGIGRLMFDELDRFATEHECGYAILASSGFRKGAHRFYESMGYTDDVKGFRKVY